MVFFVHGQLTEQKEVIDIDIIYEVDDRFHTDNEEYTIVYYPEGDSSMVMIDGITA